MEQMASHETIQRAIGQIEGKLTGIDTRLTTLHSETSAQIGKIEGMIEAAAKVQDGRIQQHGARLRKLENRWWTLSGVSAGFGAAITMIYQYFKH